MPSMEESRREVKEKLDRHLEDIDHDAILTGLQDEIDKHNGINADAEVTHRRHWREREVAHEPADSHRSMGFRFKEGTSQPRKRKHYSGHHRESRRPKAPKSDGPTPSHDHADSAAHPFPREPTDRNEPPSNSSTAFRESLFDALADDEGAAYWESVYSQPIHIYDRPTVQTEGGELEQMNDDEYAAYVQTKMWERKHPEIVREREKSDRKRRLEEEERTRRREEHVRKKQRSAWEKAQAWTGRESDHESEDRGNAGFEPQFTGQANIASSRKERELELATAWSTYLRSWERLKQDFLDNAEKHCQSPDKPKPLKPSSRLPWPVLPHKPVTRSNIEEFMSNAPTNSEHPRLRILKSERVRWHPDKIQHRFGGEVDDGTMKIVTGIFQVVDALLEEERKRTGSR